MDTNLDKFWAKVDKNHPSGCWLWTGSKVASGYGQTFFNGKMERVHRVVYRLLKGEITDGLFVCHSCDVRACCNPDHLWLGTLQDNNKDALDKGRTFKEFHKKGGNHPNAKITDEQRAEIKLLQSQGVSYRKLAKQFGLSYASTHAVCNGKDYSCRKKK